MSEPIIIYRLGSLGDTVMALPVFHFLRKRFPNQSLVVLTNKPASPLAPHLANVLEGSGLVDSFLDYPLGLRSGKGLIELRQRIQGVGARHLIYLAAPRGLPNILRDIFFFRMCGIAKITGAPVARQDRTVVFDHSKSLFEWEAVRLARRLASLGNVDLDDASAWDLGLSSAEIASAHEQLARHGVSGKCFCVGVGTKQPTNDWGEQNWVSLLQRLGQEHPDAGLAFIGADSDIPRAAKCAQSWQGPVANLCGLLTPRQSAAILKHAKLFVGHDSGPMHLAGAVGVPITALFSANNYPGLWYPRGQHNEILFPGTKSPDFQRVSSGQSIIRNITVDDVLHAVRAALARKSGT